MNSASRPQHFEVQDEVLYQRPGSAELRRGRVLEVDRAESGDLDWLLVQEPFEGDEDDADLHQHRAPARQACLVHSKRRAFIDDVLAMVDASIWQTVLGDALDRCWIEHMAVSPGDEDDEALVDMLRGERDTRIQAREEAKTLSAAVQAELRESWEGTREDQQATSWIAGREWWLGYAESAPHGRPRRRTAVLLAHPPGDPGELGEGAYAELVDRTRPLRDRCRLALARLNPPDIEEL